MDEDYYDDRDPGLARNRPGRGRQAPFGNRHNRGDRARGATAAAGGAPGGQRGRGHQRRDGAPLRRAQGHGQVFQFQPAANPLIPGDNENLQNQNANIGQNQHFENQYANVRRNYRNYNNDANHFQQDAGRPMNQFNRQIPDDRNQNSNMGQNDQRNNNAQNRNNNRPQRNRCMGFTSLQEIAQSDNKDIFIKINERKDAFINLLDSTIDKDKADLFALIMKIISKVCHSQFDSLKHTLLLKICSLKFIGSMRIYLMDLPYVDTHAKTRNRLYWQNEQEFWENIATFCECIIDISPGTALEHCRSLIEATAEVCLRGLSERHGFTLSAECSAKIAELRERLVVYEINKAETQQEVKKNTLPAETGEPPEDFRQLSVLPGRDDLLNISPMFLRPNIVSGAYRDMEHYLDVQFRLLREDCFGPLREGILQYIENPTRKKFDNIRVLNNVKFVEPYISQSKIGSAVEFDDKTKKRFKKTNWAHSDRFKFGSLLLFTKDKCRTFITATILDRDVKMLNQGKIPVSTVGTINENLYNGDSYVMLESEVYFEPYYHVLKAMQDPKFPENLAMSKYIVNVDPVPRPPAYLRPDVAYTVQIENFVDCSKKFRVLDDQTWPTKEELGFNGSQYEAYKLALTHEFAVIQGPPGTGKTFLGVKVAKTLIENLSSKAGGCPMLVICYTNHALDQFLEAILPVTQSIVRFGGQSRNEAMQNLNINKLRGSQSTRLFHEQRHDLKRAVLQLQHAQERLDSLNNGVISYISVKENAPESEALGIYYSINRRGVKSDPLKHWLFEHMVLVDFETIITEKIGEQNIEVVYDVDEEINDRVAIILDDFEDNETEEIVEFSDYHISTSFTIKDAEKKLMTLIMLYNRVNDSKKRERQQEIVDLKSRITLFEEMSQYRNIESALRLHGGMDLSRVPLPVRWALYFRWAHLVTHQIKAHITPLQEELELAKTAYEESRIIMDLRILKNIKVVGMTTSGAARLRKLLQGLAPAIVIVEEAAEVLEQHIITSLTKDCKHLILIGDHQQLRPSAAYIKLARKYNIEVSLFERMITNGMPSRRLGVQHRMRPELAALIAPHIYQDLENHPSVEHFPSVRGVADNLFFLSHDYKEEAVDDSSSRSNQQEGDLALRLAKYLVQQGYEACEVTILAAYSGQMFYMRKQRENYAPYLSQVKITVLDNYQGEESKIIILSLVRNNHENKIGFLGTENRICVALSRAREGFYIMGNVDILKRNSSLWKNIAGTLEANASVGTSMMLKCENHRGQITIITSPADFEKVPEGGCLLKCNYNLPCGHQCPLVCHGYDRGHAEIKCFLQCERVLCELGHVCPRKCFKKCKPCAVPVEKELPCGHKKLLHCHMEPTDASVKCLVFVKVTLPDCGHEARKPCYMEIAQVRCAVPCEYRVDRCGHECRLKCHVRDDPEHERYRCEKPCAKAKKACTTELIDRGDHQCPKMCYEDCDYCTVEVLKKRSTCTHKERVACNIDVNETPCRKKCSRVLPCSHFCMKKCHEKCGDCAQKVKKVIPECKHEVNVMCKREPTRDLCERKCERTLPCGHPCTDRCSATCEPTKCTQLIQVALDSPCGHKVMLPCNVFYATYKRSNLIEPELLLQHCSAPCGAELACAHACGGTCSLCHQGRLHAACTRTCHQTNICGHQCQEPCNQVCPPCKMPCEMRCPHSRCRKLCGAPCTPCQEPCPRVCPHGACGRRCSEPCTRPPCDEPCNKTRPCGHRCRGLCGEPCPDICKTCRPEQFPTDFLGDEYEDGDKFVQLQDCTHVLDVENMDNLMMGDRETVTIRACPMCRQPIVNTQRYKDYVNNMFKTEINPIKERVYGNETVIKTKREELFLKVVAFRDDQKNIMNENSHYKEAFNKLRAVVTSQKKVSLLQLEMQFQYLTILDMIGGCYRKYKAANVTELHNELLDVIKLICSVLLDKTQKISQQLQMDIGNEMKRMNSIIQLSQILNHTEYKSSKALTNVATAANEAKKVVLTWGIYEENTALTALKRLQQTVKLSGIVSKEERDLIVMAIGSKAGSWYKCPNGHIYSIADCGGAMVVSKCADCGVAIGGTNHTLLANNAHAGEVDGSARSAWSDAYNNMANFDLRI